MATRYRSKRKIKAFQFKPFSRKAKKLLYWWEEGSPHKDRDMMIADGSIRSAKTITMICSFLRWSQDTFDGENFIVAGKSIGALKRNVLDPMKKILESWGWKYYHHKSENYIMIGNNMYYLFGANNEASQDVLQGLTAAGAYADEVALMPKSFVDQMIGRCSVDGRKIFLNCNPQGPYHWFKTEFIDKRKEKNIYYLHFILDDNLTLSEKIKEGYKRMFSGVFFKRYILGLWVLAEGIIYDMFREDIHVIDKAPEVMDQMFVVVDYGTSTVTTFLLIGRKDGVYYVLDEYYYDATKSGRQKDDSQFADDFEEFVQGLQIKRIYYDTNGASFAAELRKRGFKKKLKPAIKGPGSVIAGIREVSKAFNKNKLFILRKCKNVIRECLSYLWDPKKQLVGEDVPLKQHDHAMDAMRYLIYAMYIYSSRKSKKKGLDVTAADLGL